MKTVSVFNQKQMNEFFDKLVENDMIGVSDAEGLHDIIRGLNNARVKVNDEGLATEVEIINGDTKGAKSYILYDDESNIMSHVIDGQKVVTEKLSDSVERHTATFDNLRVETLKSNDGSTNRTNTSYYIGDELFDETIEEVERNEAETYQRILSNEFGYDEVITTDIGDIEATEIGLINGKIAHKNINTRCEEESLVLDSTTVTGYRVYEVQHPKYSKTSMFENFLINEEEIIYTEGDIRRVSLYYNIFQDVIGAIVENEDKTSTIYKPKGYTEDKYYKIDLGKTEWEISVCKGPNKRHELVVSPNRKNERKIILEDSIDSFDGLDISICEDEEVLSLLNKKDRGFSVINNLQLSNAEIDMNNHQVRSIKGVSPLATAFDFEFQYDNDSTLTPMSVCDKVTGNYERVYDAPFDDVEITEVCMNGVVNMTIIEGNTSHLIVSVDGKETYRKFVYKDEMTGNMIDIVNGKLIKSVMKNHLDIVRYNDLIISEEQTQYPNGEIDSTRVWGLNRYNITHGDKTIVVEMNKYGSVQNVSVMNSDPNIPGVSIRIIFNPNLNIQFAIAENDDTVISYDPEEEDTPKFKVMDKNKED